MNRVMRTRQIGIRTTCSLLLAAGLGLALGGCAAERGGGAAERAGPQKGGGNRKPWDC